MKHDWKHWLAVVIKQTVISIIWLPISLYLAMFGYLLSIEIVRPNLPIQWLGKGRYFFSQLPYYFSIKNWLFSHLGNWYQNTPIWWTMVIGIPFVIMAICLLLINFFNLYYAIFSHQYNQSHCPWCSKKLAVHAQF